MYRLMRNSHLILGLSFVLMALLFALSSLVIIYRPFLPSGHEDSERIVTVETPDTSDARELALALMRDPGLRGELRQVKESPQEISFRIVRPGVQADVVFDRTESKARINTRRYGVLETLVQLHVNHGFWHEFLPSNIWALLSLLASVGLLLLGLSGLYLWFRQHKERLVGGILVTAGLIYALVALTLARVRW